VTLDAGSRFPESADIETSSENYARRFAGRVGEYFLEIQSRAVLDLLTPWPGSRLLEVGGGHAQVAVPLVRHGYHLTVSGSDERCRARLDRLLPPGSFDFRCCDMLNLPFPDRHFEVVLAFRLLPHVERWSDLICEMCRVARTAVVLDYPEVRSFNAVQRPFFEWKKAIERDTRRFRCFRRRDLLSEFAHHGFGHPASRPEFLFPMVIHRAARSVVFSQCLEAPPRVLGLTRALGSPVVLRVVRTDSS
jgi:SAM-dependent methyltransferase